MDGSQPATSVHLLQLDAQPADLHLRVEATEDAEKSWTEHCQELASMTLLTKTDSWFVGVNVNLPEKKRTVLQYMGGAPLFEEKCNEVAAKGYEGFTLE